MRDRVRLVRAPNPSPMTLDGTNTYVIALDDGRAAVVDPGPVDARHLEAIVAAAAGATIAYVLVTHGHPDHYPGAAPLAARTGAPVVAHAEARFPHDRVLADRERLADTGAVAITALATPGHSRDSLTFVCEAAGETVLFTGDLVIGHGTVVVAPPNGDMRAYQASLRRLRAEYAHAAAICGGHGPRVDDVAGKLDEYLAHREARERAIVAGLANGPTTIPELVAAIYANVGRHLWPAAGRQVLATLEALQREGAVTAAPLAREVTPEERAILNPDLRLLADEATAAVARAELGYADVGEPLVAYALTRAS